MALKLIRHVGSITASTLGDDAAHGLALGKLGQSNVFRINEFGGQDVFIKVTDSDTGTATGDITNPDTLRRLNAYIGTIGNMEYLLPEHALNRLRTSLMKVGLSFGEIPAMEGMNGSFDLPLTRFGGRFGKDENTPSDEFINDDGISHIIEGGLALKINYEMSPKNNSCRVFAKIA